FGKEGEIVSSNIFDLRVDVIERDVTAWPYVSRHGTGSETNDSDAIERLSREIHHLSDRSAGMVIGCRLTRMIRILGTVSGIAMTQAAERSVSQNLLHSKEIARHIESIRSLNVLGQDDGVGD